MLSRLSVGAAIASVGFGDVLELLRVGAVFVDVREQGEWDADHHPLGGLATSMNRLHGPHRGRGLPMRETLASATEALTKAGLDAVDRAGGFSGLAGRW